MIKQLMRKIKLDLNILDDRKMIVYGSRRDVAIFTLRLPLLMVFAILAFPFFALWCIWLGIKSFWSEFKEEMIDEGVILLPVMGFITAYRLIAYKKVKRGGENE